MPSLRNIIKSALMCGNHATATYVIRYCVCALRKSHSRSLILYRLCSTAVGELRTSIQKLKLLNPPLWFESTMQQGVMWLNTALTFTSKDQAELARHVAFWNPVITEIFRTILEAKAAAKTSNNKAGVVFLMWGAYAKSFKKLVRRGNRFAATISSVLTLSIDLETRCATESRSHGRVRRGTPPSGRSVRATSSTELHARERGSRASGRAAGRLATTPRVTLTRANIPSYYTKAP